MGDFEGIRGGYSSPKFAHPTSFHKFPPPEGADFSPVGPTTPQYLMKRTGFPPPGTTPPFQPPPSPTLSAHSLPMTPPPGVGPLGLSSLSGGGHSTSSSSPMLSGTSLHPSAAPFPPPSSLITTASSSSSSSSPSLSTQVANSAVSSTTATNSAVSSTTAEDEDPGGWNGLDMTRMGLRNLSLRLGIYQHLKMLYLAHNQLSVLPGVLCTKLTSLHTLDLSHNMLTALPTEIGGLYNLKMLLLYNNRITELPLEMGKLFKLSTLVVEANPIVKPAPSVLAQGASKIVAFLRDRLEPPPLPPDRSWLSYVEHESYKGAHHAAKPKIRVMAYNVLADAYATPDRYAYCPSWALVWSYRKGKILKELADSQADLICLQEIETGDYQEFFQEAMLKLGYHGIFKPKSRAYMSGVNTQKVDGCAIFYRASRFNLVLENVIEFQRLALARHSKISSDTSQSGHERLYQRDNIAVVAVFELIEDKPPARSGRPAKGHTPHKIIVCNTHVHWNPELADVKLMQTQMMMEELMAMRNKLRYESPVSKLAPMIVCGDFNSEPNSGVYELLSQGEVPPEHPDFGSYRYGVYSQQGLKHTIPLVSAYNPHGAGEPPFTNYTASYVGVLDYIFLTKDTIRPCGVAEHVSKQVIMNQGYALPSPHFPSDHLSLIADLEIL